MGRGSGFRRYFRLDLPRGARLDEDIAAELRFHVDSRVDELVAAGMRPDVARDTALREFGDVHRITRSCRDIGRQRERDMRIKEWLDSVAGDVSFGWRSLRGTPVFATVAVLTLALGIGATSAIFSVVSAVLLRPLPFEDAQRIVHLGEHARTDPQPATTTSTPNYEDWRRLARSFAAIGIYDGWSPVLTGQGDPVRLSASDVSASIFDVLRIAPALGRPILPSDNQRGAPPVVLLSYGLWQERFGGSADVVGQAITLQGRPMVVVGVLPAGLRLPRELDAQLWGNFIPDTADGRGGRAKDVIARLKPGVTLEQARAEIRAIAAQLEKAYPEHNEGMTVRIDPLRDLFVGDVRQPLLLLMAASGLVLLIACANLSALLIARGVARTREFAVRAALGAGAWRAIRQLLTESLLLAMLGGAAGLALAHTATRALLTLAPASIRGQEVGLDGRVLAFTVLLTVGAGILFGITPAVRTARADLQLALKEGARGARGAGMRLRAALVVAQLALAVALLADAGLLFKSFARLQQVEPGIRPDRLLTFSLDLPRARYPERRQLSAFFARLEIELTSRPGVTGVAVGSILPFQDSFDRIGVEVEGVPALKGANQPEGDRYIVNPRYFAAMGIPLRTGRLFTDRDEHDTPLVAVVDEVFARRVFPRGDMIGRRMKLPGRDSLATIVGVVGHVKHYGLDRESSGQIYMSHLQYPWRWMNFAVRTSGDALAFTPTVRRVIGALDRDLAVYRVGTMEQLMAELSQGRRFVLILIGVFAALAIVMAAVGLYGVVAYSVTQRRQEIGIRVALGARLADVTRLVVRQGAGLTAVGVMLGLGAAVAGGRLVAGLLFGVSPRDPVVFGAVATLLAVVALAASYAPARRAAAVDPVEVLRGE
ncbi:MAG: ADOP family duplicated permease [Gemmatimonadaceae bacterium]